MRVNPKRKPVFGFEQGLMILAVFAGLGLFGFIGIVLGPVLMILIITTIQMYLEVFKDTKSITHPSIEGRVKRKFTKLAFWKTG